MKKWLAACLCTVMLLSLAACGASAEKASGPYAEMTEEEWEELWNEAKTQQDSFERIFDKQKGDYEFTERERVSSIEENFMEFLPKEYFSDVESGQKGKIDKVEYDTYDYYLYQTQGTEESQWKKETKTCYVYTPAGYSESEQYNVYFLLHRKTYTEDYWFISTVVDGEDRELGRGDFVYLLDYAIANGLIEPAIFVACTAKIGEADDEAPEHQAANFGYELKNDLIPAIDAKYSTYASREHRALGGASRGGLLVWGAMPVALPEVAYFAPICNGCVHTIYTDEQEAEADRLCDAMSTQENAQYDISYLFTFAGDCDTNKLRVYSTYDEVLKKMPDRLVWGENTYYGKPQYGTHSNKYFYLGVYESMQLFFKGAK